jgi:hypothetical protein
MRLTAIAVSSGLAFMFDLPPKDMGMLRVRQKRRAGSDPEQGQDYVPIVQSSHVRSSPVARDQAPHTPKGRSRLHRSTLRS